MSDMQLYLIALGAIIIAGVILFNWWQERRLSQDAIRRFDAPAGDPLLDERHSAVRRREIDFDESRIAIDDTFETADADIAVSMREDTFEPDEAIDEVIVEEEISIESIPDDTLLSELPQSADDLGMALSEESESLEPELADAPAPLEAEDEAAEPPPIPLPANMDEQIDLIAVVHLPGALSGAQLREALQPLPGFEKATQWQGETESGTWFPLTRDQESVAFHRVACALQYADRSGPFSRECLRKFQHKVEALAEQVEGALEWRGNGDPLKYATELDQFCIDVDVMVGFHIMHGGNGPFAATKLRGIAEAGGMQLHEDGTFHFVTESGDTLFTLVNHDQRPFTPELLRTAFIGGISFQLDVPRVRNCPEAFNQMALLAQKMEASLGGILIDDNQRPLNTEAMDKIREQLRIIYAKMVARGIIPGAPSALRLFS